MVLYGGAPCDVSRLFLNLATLARHNMFAKQASVESTHTSKLEFAMEYNCCQPCSRVSITRSCLMGHKVHKVTTTSCSSSVIQNITAATKPIFQSCWLRLCAAAQSPYECNEFLPMWPIFQEQVITTVRRAQGVRCELITRKVLTNGYC